MPRGRGRRIDRTSPATPDVAKASSGSEAPSSTVEVSTVDFSWVDASCVAKIISGEYTLDTAVKRRGPAPLGTIPSLEDCRAINVLGLSGNATEEELRSLCSKFGTVTDVNVNLLNCKADGGLGCATITFEKAPAAQEAQSSLQRTILHGEEIRVVLDLDKDKNQHWLHVWISEGVTARELYRGFLSAGAPCIDARVVRKSSVKEPQGVGAVAFRTEWEWEAVHYALPMSSKTKWWKHPKMHFSLKLSKHGLKTWDV